MSVWKSDIPDRLGPLPLGGDLVRTDPGGSPDAQIAVLGVYPALTKMARFPSPEGPINVPVAVEKTSFEPTSSSGREIDDRYLGPLGLSRSDVFLIDMMPYFLANTAKSGDKHRSMWDNVQSYERVTGEQTAIRPRPHPDDLLAECRAMPGNLDRLASELGSHPRRLLLTLGNEAAAFARGDVVAKDAQPHLLEEPRTIDFLGRAYSVVHLPHPGVLIRTKAWRERHETWCRGRGRALVQDWVLGKPRS